MKLQIDAKRSDSNTDKHGYKIIENWTFIDNWSLDIDLKLGIRNYYNVSLDI